jgi:hypothetical protein
MASFDPSLLHDFPDRAVRRLLQEPDNLRDLLGEVVPALVGGFDCKRAELQPPVFSLDDWRHRESDLLYLIPYRSGPRRRKVLVCVLVEHQSAPDPRMPLRVLLYTTLFWERQWKAWEDRQPPRPPLRLTPVLPIVFHTGPRPWNAARSLAELINAPEGLRAFVPAYQPLFWDLAEQSPEALLASAAEWLQALAVMRAAGEDQEEFARVMGLAAQHLRGLAGTDPVRWHGLLWFILAWALHRRPREEHLTLIELARAAQMEGPQQGEVRAMGQTIAEALREEGKKEGKKEGRHEGELHRARVLLVGLLRHRFGRVPKALRQQIETMTDLKRLEEDLYRAAEVPSLDALQL